MAGTFLNSDVVVNELLLAFQNELGIGRFVKHEYDKEFGKSGAKKGDTIRLRDQVQLTIGEGDAITPQSIEERSRNLTLNYHKHVAWEWTVREETLNVDQWMTRYGLEAVRQLANDLDRTGMRLAAQGTGNTVGTFDTAVAAFRTFNDGRAGIRRFAAPASNDILFLVDEATEVDAVTLAQAFFQSQNQIKRQYEDGNMGRANGGNWHMTQNVYRHTVGPLGGTPTVNGAGQTGANIITAAWTAAAANRLLLGDVVTFAGCNAVNPITKQNLGRLREFVVTADTSSDGAGALTIPISPSIEVTGPYQNVSASPTNGGAVLTFGTASSHQNEIGANNIIMHPDAMVLAMAPMYVPKNLDFGAMRQDPDTGLAISFARDFDILTHKLITRVDVLAGWAVTHQDWIYRLLAD